MPIHLEASILHDGVGRKEKASGNGSSTRRRFLGQSAEIGTIAEAHPAGLLLLDGNPSRGRREREPRRAGVMLRDR